MSLINILLRSRIIFTSKCCHEHQIGALSPIVQFIRWRKPRWEPKAKSKIFYVRTPTPIDPQESEELKLRYAHYRTHLRAVRRYLSQSLQEQKQQKMVDDDLEQKELDDIQWMISENDKWNEQSAKLREARLGEEIKQKELKLRLKAEKELDRKVTMIEKAQKKLQKELEDIQSEITLDNLDVEIEKLLNQRKDYNFAIDPRGQIITDEILKTEEKEKSASSVKTS